MRRFALLFAVLALSAGLTAADAPKAPDLLGYCPVAYVKMAKPIKGQMDLASTVGGHTYWFANADAKAIFDADPSKFSVACDGYCAFASAKGMVFPGDPQIFSVKNNRIYFFINEDTKKAFDADAAMAGQAEGNWAKIAPKR